ncbi:MAG: hypothetical protein L0Z62_26635 [Gemmataceae bacterium]|nr:hypothetical protein [Gemmataceae bacterium]
MRPFNTPGFWYLPDNPGRAIAGNLRYTEKDGLRLSLTEMLSEPTGRVEPVTYEKILGVVQGNPYGSRVVLVNCAQTGFTIFLPNTGTEELRAQLGYITDGPLAETPFVINDAEFSYDHLDEWIGISPFELKWSTGGSKLLGVSYQEQPSITFPINGHSLSIDHHVRASHSASWVRLQGMVSLRVSGLAVNSIDTLFVDYANPLQNLITFATGTAASVDRLTIFSEQVKYLSIDEKAPIHVLYQPIYVPRQHVTPKSGNKREQTLHFTEMLFSFPEIQGAAEAVFSRWLSFSRTFRPFCNLFFGLQYAPPRFLDITLLQIATAATVFCKIANLPSARFGQEIIQLQRAVIDAASEHDTRWLSRVLPKEQDVDFPWHLLALFQEHSQAIAPLIQGDPVGFIDDFLTLRDSILHGEPLAAQPNPRGRSLHRAVGVLTVLLKACVLKELGFSSDFITAALRRDRGYLPLLAMQREPAEEMDSA